MKKRHIFFTALTAITITGAVLFGAEQTNSPFGVVNFTSCITDSKIGKQEQGSFENLNKQMTSLIEDSNKQLQDLSQKLNNSEYLDGLSPEAEQELREKYAALGEELNRYQGQFYQVMNQANMRLIQTISQQINSASEKVAKAKKLNLIVNKEAVFFYDPKLDITTQIIAQMDKAFDEENKKDEVAMSKEVAESDKKAK
jgi:outer membrane protein